jgi:hypothetical protein
MTKDTPRTNDEQLKNTHPYIALKSNGWDFARTLEQENAMLLDKIKGLEIELEVWQEP